MPTLASDLIESTRRHLFTGQPEKLNKLAAAITDANATTFSLTYDVGGIQAGTIVAIELEEIFVFSVDAVSKTVQDCIRGYNGTTKATHVISSVVTVQPKFSSFRILEAINDDLKDLSSPLNGLYQLKTKDLTFNPVTYGYDLAGVTSMVGIQEVRFRTTGPQKTWPKIDSWQLLRNATTTGTFGDFPSGFGLVIYESAQSGYPIHVVYKAPFVALSLLTDNVTSVTGLADTMLDLPPIGAAIRLIAGREVKRNFDESQGEPRRAEEVPPQANIQSMRGLQSLRRDRIMAESVRLQRAYSYEFVG